MSKHNLIEYLNRHEISLGLSSNTSELRFINDTVGYGKFSTQDIKEGDIIKSICNNEKILKKLKWKPKYNNLNLMVKDTIKWFDYIY